MIFDSKHNIKLQTGWGLNFVRIANPTPNPPTIPPLFFGFQSGAGGGGSIVYAKPKFQRQLPGKFRQTPDIAMNADPETGAEIIVTPTSVPGDPAFVEVFGGTSLSCPMFSAFWTIANQANQSAGGGSLGQAAPILHQLPDDAIRDVNVRQVDTLFDVSGIISQPAKSSDVRERCGAGTTFGKHQAVCKRFVPEPLINALGCFYFWDRFLVNYGSWLG
jgi:subtilase family serine protease